MTTEIDKENGELRRRSIYLAMRIKALKEEVAELRAEETKAGASLRSSADKKSTESKALKSRLIYLRLRPDEARKEIEAATAEKKQLMGILRPAPEQ